MNRAMLVCVAVATLAIPPPAIAAPDCISVARIGCDAEAVAFNHAGDRILADPAGGRLLVRPVYAPETLVFGRPGSGPGEFNQPVALAVGPGDEILVVDAGNHRIQVLARDGAFLRMWGAAGSGPGRFLSPRGITVDGHGLVYVSDPAASRIQVFDLHGTLLDVRPLSRPAGGGHGEHVTLLAAGEILSPGAMASGADGSLYVLDAAAAVIHVFDARGERIDVWGRAGDQRQRMFSSPAGIGVCGGSDLLYVADAGAGEIRILTPTGYDVGAWSGYAEPGVAPGGRPPGDDVAVPLGTAAPVPLRRPQALAVGRDGSVLVADGSTLVGFAFAHCPARIVLDLVPGSCGADRPVQAGASYPVVLFGGAGTPWNRLTSGSLVFGSGWTPASTRLEDVGGCVTRNGAATAIPEDGIPDLVAMVTADVWEELRALEHPATVTVRGRLTDGTPVWGVDRVEVTGIGLPAGGRPIDRFAQLAYRLDEVTEVRAAVFDVSGRRVAELVHGAQGPGDHVVAWRPESVPDGVYFLDLRAGTEHRTVKVIVRR